MPIEYREFDFAPYIERIKEIYAEEGWYAYLQDDEKLKRAFENSFYLLGAFDSKKLIGFLRCVGDGEHIILIQDLILDKAYRRKKIGSTLFKMTSEYFQNARMFHVVTDIRDVADNAFYRSFGMKKLADGDMISYFRP